VVKTKKSDLFRRLGLGAFISAACLSTALPAPASAAPRAPSAGCADVDFLFARGTGEGGGAIGNLGNQLATALQAKLPGENVSANGLDYPASPVDPLSATKGVNELSRYLTEKIAQCPNTKYVIGGYSQGAAVVSEALGADLYWIFGTRLSSQAVAKISAIVTFGNPLTGLPPVGRHTTIGKEVPGLDGRTYEACAMLDPVCDFSGDWAGGHLNYYNNGSVPFVAGYIAEHV
jgi:cutinase